MTKSIDKLRESRIEYSKRVFIDIQEIMKKTDKDTLNVIWKHILTISALVDPAGRAKELLKSNSTKTTANETNFLENIINKVESNINPDVNNPMEAVSSLLSSGVFGDLLSGMNNGIQDGSLDLGKLMGTVEKILPSILPSGGGAGNGGGGGAPNLMSMMAPLLSKMSQSSGGGDGKLDIHGLMSEIMNTTQNNDSKTLVEEVKKD